MSMPVNPQWERVNDDTDRLNIGCGYLIRVAGVGIVYVEGDHRLPASEDALGIVSDAVDRIVDILDDRLPPRESS